MFTVSQNKYAKQVTFEVLDSTDGEVVAEFKGIGESQSEFDNAKKRAESHANYQNLLLNKAIVNGFLSNVLNSAGIK